MFAISYRLPIVTPLRCRLFFPMGDMAPHALRRHNLQKTAQLPESWPLRPCLQLPAIVHACYLLESRPVPHGRELLHALMVAKGIWQDNQHADKLKPRNMPAKAMLSERFLSVGDLHFHFSRCCGSSEKRTARTNGPAGMAGAGCEVNTALVSLDPVVHTGLLPDVLEPVALAVVAEPSRLEGSVSSILQLISCGVQRLVGRVQWQ